MIPKRKDGLPEVTQSQVLAHLATVAHPASVREIARALNLKHEGRRLLPKLISKLKRRGEIEEVRAGRYRLSGPSKVLRETQDHPAAPSAGRPTGSKYARDPKLISGRVVAHHEGYGFLVPDEPIPGVAGDLFLAAGHLGDAMHGDHVLARIDRRRADGRAEGHVVQILEREHSTIVGLFRYGSQGNFVLPYDTRILHEVLIPPGEELTPALRQKLGSVSGAEIAASRRMRVEELDGAVVNAEITRFPKGGLSPTGRVIEVLGRPGQLGVDVEIIIRKHHLPHVFPPEALTEARATPQHVTERDLAGRRDFRHLSIVTIDGESARDFDDAVFVAALPGGHYELQVHIADVAHYVRRGSALDREARLRGNSVYFPDRALPMLPEELSNGICSLNPRVDRLVMSVVMEIDAAGNPLHADFAPGVIRSAERMTYTDVNKVLEGDPQANRRYGALADGFRQMKELALLLHKRREARGSIDFDLPEPVIEFDEAGRMMSIVRSERNIAHRIIEEFMLVANGAVARYLEKREIPSLYRVHEKPDPKKVAEFEELAHTFGYSLGVENLAERRMAVRHGRVQFTARPGRTGSGRSRPMTVILPASAELEISPHHFQRLIKKIAGKPEERILSYLMLRSLRQARYAAELLGHFALAVKEYTHFTSPIRRCPDLIVHRILKWALENPPGSVAGVVKGPYRRVELEAIASESSENERRADAAERELMDWKTAEFMESRLGEEYDALIISVVKFGFFVELLEVFVEGLVSIERLEEVTGQRCIYRERDHAIVTEAHRGGRNREPRIFRLGDRLRVRAERIDPFRHRVEFSVV